MTTSGLATVPAEGAQLAQALRYVAAWRGKRVLIKFGGAAMAKGDLGTLVDDIVALQQAGVLPILVHGGGKEISCRLAERGIEARFIDGLRVTDAATMAVVEEVLGGEANRRLVELLRAAGGDAVGVSGCHGVLLVVPHPRRELGFVGSVERVEPAAIERLLGEGRIPVVAPLGVGVDGHAYNLNADTAAAALAGALRAEKFLLLTDVRGVLSEPSEAAAGSGAGAGERTLLAELSPGDARRLIEDGTIGSGMIPKVEACLAALEHGVPRAHVLLASLPHGLLVELFTQTGVGTMITDRVRSGHVLPRRRRDSR